MDLRVTFTRIDLWVSRCTLVDFPYNKTKCSYRQMRNNTTGNWISPDVKRRSKGYEIANKLTYYYVVLKTKAEKYICNITAFANLCRTLLYFCVSASRSRVHFAPVNVNFTSKLDKLIYYVELYHLWYSHLIKYIGNGGK